MMKQRRRMLMQAQPFDDNLLKETTDGFVDGQGKLTFNSTYPYSYYYNEVTLEAGKSYVMDFEVLSLDNTQNGNRFRIYDRQGFYINSATSYQWSFGLQLQASDSVNFYNSARYTINPTETRKVRILIVRKINNQRPTIKLYEV